MAFAAKATARPRTLASLNDMPIEDELCFTRMMASRLWRLLKLRHPSVAAELADALTVDARAMVDRSFEASLLLFERHRIDVTPCRKLLYCQDEGAPSYVLTRVTGETEIIDDAKLLMMAGLTG